MSGFCGRPYLLKWPDTVHTAGGGRMFAATCNDCMLADDPARMTEFGMYQGSVLQSKAARATFGMREMMKR